MKYMKIIQAALLAGIALCGLVGMRLAAQQNKDTVKVPGSGLALSEFQGYEHWEIVGPSFTDAAHVIRAVLANPVMIKAYREGVPANGKPFPDGSKIAKIEWLPKTITSAPFSASTPDTVPGALKELEYIEKDSKRFPDTHGWGYAAFKYDATTDQLTPVSSTDNPPQGNDATCGAACHTIAMQTDFIFTAYQKR
jgi:Cytochrome P460